MLTDRWIARVRGKSESMGAIAQLCTHMAWIQNLNRTGIDQDPDVHIIRLSGSTGTYLKQLRDFEDIQTRMRALGVELLELRLLNSDREYYEVFASEYWSDWREFATQIYTITTTLFSIVLGYIILVGLSNVLESRVAIVFASITATD
jgi:hypothetical protein